MRSGVTTAANGLDTIRVVVADDSPFVCRLLTAYLESSPDIQVVAKALNGVAAVELVHTLRPDALTLDLDMPGMDGLQVLEQIMHDCPTPAIMVSGVSQQAATVTLKALEMGAVDFVLKYTPGTDTDPELLRQEIIAKVRAASHVKVIRSLRTTTRRQAPDLLQVKSRPDTGEPGSPAVVRVDSAGDETANLFIALPEAAPYLPFNVIVIGASTGGPVALRELLSHLPADFPAAIVVVQHIPAGFTEVLAAQLDRQVPIHVKEAATGDRLEAGLALIAPADHHLLLKSNASITLNRGPEIKGHRPSIDVTMQSIAQVYGSRTIGVVLTGMGSDGVLGLAEIRAKGGQTFAQDAATCVIDGMPRRAIERGVVDRVGSPVEIAHLLEVVPGRKYSRE
jgi:two-component system chemotaxis response regulator CheB